MKNQLYFNAILYFRVVKAIMEHEEMKGIFGSVCEDFQQRFNLMSLDISDLPKMHSTNKETIHFVTKGDANEMFVLAQA